jgi:pyridoxine 5-phosphate synthase
MTHLSVNVNKIALLRNSRGRDFPNVVEFAKKFIDLGVQGITIHPRQDERHIKRQDARDLAEFLKAYPEAELNIEGYPSQNFMKLIEETKPDQCTLVPDAANQLTSDHGWDIKREGVFLKEIISRIKQAGCRTSLFTDPDIKQIKLVPETGADRIELYTETFASTFNTPKAEKTFSRFKTAAEEAQRIGLGVNAGHDLDLYNLSRFLEINGILEVSIGHALIVVCIEFGMKKVIRRYLDICQR